MSLPLVTIDHLLPLTLSEVQDVLLGSPRKHVGALTLGDLASHPTHPNGCYLFFHGSSPEPFYIGRSSSRSFIGRLPSHFEPHFDFWMNGLSKGMQSSGLAPSYSDGVIQALSCDLVLVGFRYPERREKTSFEQEMRLRRLRINALELVLQRFMQPILTARPNPYSGAELLTSLLPNSVA